MGIDRRANPWSDRITTLIADLATTSPAGTLGGLETRPADVVVHLAAHAKVHELVHLPALALENIIATHTVLEYCRHWRVPMIFASSREVYGDFHRFDTDETRADFAYTESTYSASKIAGEAMIYGHARCYGMRYIVFRFSNVYGRYDNDLNRMERVVPLFIWRIARGLPIVVYGKDKILDFTYVDDCVDGVLRGIGAIHEDRIGNQTINLASGFGHSLVEMATYIGEALGRTPEITLAPTQIGEVTHYIANLEKARSLLGYFPKFKLREGIQQAVEWNLSSGAI